MAELARTEKNVEFIDLFPTFLDAKGQHRAELFVEDGTHFNANGYLPHETFPVCQLQPHQHRTHSQSDMSRQGWISRPRVAGFALA